jgi:hypothetical protein
LINNRHVPYDRTPIDQLGLPQDVCDAILEELAQMPPEFQSLLMSTPDVMLNVPYVSQLDEDSPDPLDCGHACVLMLLKYYDNPPSPTILSNTTVHALVETMRNIDTRNGKPRRAQNLTSHIDLIALAKEFGLDIKAEIPFKKVDKIVKALDKRRPVVPLVNYKDLKFPKHLDTGDDQGWHWLVVVGYADNGDTFIVNDPLWTLDRRSGRGGAGLAISRQDLTNALRGNVAVL